MESTCFFLGIGPTPQKLKDPRPENHPWIPLRYSMWSGQRQGTLWYEWCQLGGEPRGESEAGSISGAPRGPAGEAGARIACEQLF